MTRTTSPSEPEPALLVGESLIGASHLRRRERNQDAVKLRRYGYGCVAAVADGVGSQRFSAFGSRAAVEAVHQVFCAYVRGDVKRIQITRTIAQRYVELVKPQYREEAATTCIFAAHLYKEGLFLGQMGDGICCGFVNGAPFFLGEKEETFSNLVAPLSADGQEPVQSWQTRFISGGRLHSIELMLATDGVSEDLLPGREAVFVRHLIGILTAQDKKTRRERLRQVLEQWETPLSQDDKTIGLYCWARR